MSIKSAAAGREALRKLRAGRNGGVLRDLAEIPAAYLTHELRAPITAVRLGLEIIRESASSRLSDNEKNILAISIRNTARLESLVDDIMDFAKISAGRMELRPEPVWPRDLLTEAVEGLKAMAVAKGVRLIKEEHGSLPRVTGESKRLIQVLTNLISNALKFTPSRGKVVVSAKRGRFDHEGTVVFRVKDSGPGIAPDALDRIFAPFVRDEEGGKGEVKGTGLGLALSKVLVGLHGGKIWAESWPGIGAEFYFTIPISPDDRLEAGPVYEEPVEYHGLIFSLARRLNAFFAFFGA